MIARSIAVQMQKQPVAYGVAQGARLKQEDADVLGPVIQTIKDRRGVVTPEMLLAEARKASSPAHGYFEWDDKSAAESFRLVRAGYLIRSITIEVIQKKAPVKTRAFHVVTRPTGERGYVDSAEIASTPDLSSQVIARALSELRGWQARYERYREMGPLPEVFAAIDKAITTQAPREP